MQIPDLTQVAPPLFDMGIITGVGDCLPIHHGYNLVSIAHQSQRSSLNKMKFQNY